ncbi:hypothetical protein DB30_00937 [Enhygromyxa salina]|uniref:Lipoprotein n=1 Tax=Enhygromyxa salina TaxID=215803 RepID=A0A0C2CTD2_9BACT|nr:hypothetical protein [Enhygromyxa salina]KIG12870.1 hypothetical protein DB30_00937 [Enhygromyxa salina]
MLRPRLALALLLPLALLACDKAEDKPADATADKAEKPADKPADKPVAKPKKLEQPWKPSDVIGAMKVGTTLVYKQTGKDIKGKDVDDDFKCEVKTASDTEVGTVCNGVNHPSEDKGATMVATAEWTEFSPFFSVSRPEVKLIERADLTVPAGTFDTVQAELAGFFGNNYTVWMIADKPGVYAKVLKHPNSGTEGDQTELVFELSSL